MSKPTILLIPGAFALPKLYDEVVGGVAARGYEIRALHLPSVGLDHGVGREGAPPTMHDDAAFIAAEVRRAADEGADVVLVAHSYGGVPASQCAEGLAKEDRRGRGERGGLVRLAYVTCLVPPVGMAGLDVLKEGASDERVEMKQDVSRQPPLLPPTPPPGLPLKRQKPPLQPYSPYPSLPLSPPSDRTRR